MTTESDFVAWDTVISDLHPDQGYSWQWKNLFIFFPLSANLIKISLISKVGVALNRWFNQNTNVKVPGQPGLPTMPPYAGLEERGCVNRWWGPRKDPARFCNNVKKKTFKYHNLQMKTFKIMGRQLWNGIIRIMRCLSGRFPSQGPAWILLSSFHERPQRDQPWLLLKSNQYLYSQPPGGNFFL